MIVWKSATKYLQERTEIYILDIRQRKELYLMDFIEKIGNTISVKGKEAAGKAKEMAEIANLKSQISTCEDVMKKNYMEIGKLYYEQNGENPDPDFEKQCRSIQNARNGIRELNAKIDEIKGL